MFFCMVVVALCAIAFAYKLVEKSRHPLFFKEHIIEAGQMFDIEPSLIASLINVESSFNPYAVSNKGAVGLMQLLPSTAVWLATRLNWQDFDQNNLTDPKTNIFLGTYYMKYLFEKFGVWHTALCAYNAGEGVVGTWLNNSQYSADGKTLNTIPYEETKNHIEKISKNLIVYKKWI